MNSIPFSNFKHKETYSMKEEFESEILEEQNLLQRDADMQLIKLNNYYSSHQKELVESFFQKEYR